MSKVQDDEVGDGTTSVTVLAAELLRVIQHWNLRFKVCTLFILLALEYLSILRGEVAMF